MSMVPAPNVRHATINHANTLKTIALRELGDAARWVELALLNGLRPPYIAAAASSGVLAYGDQISIPAPFSTASANADPNLVFDVDLSLKYGVLQAENGDFVLVSGVKNLAQALQHHIDVDKRDLMFHPEYGCWVRSLIGTSNSANSGNLAAFYVKSALLEDERVQSVSSCTAEIVGDKIKVTAVAVAISGRPVDLQVVI